LKIVFAGGGTGGHLMAGLSIAQEISSRFPGTRIIFFGTNRKKESKYIEKSSYEFKPIMACKPTSFIRLPLFIFASLIGITHSLINLFIIKPDIIVGLGGYGSALPAVAAYIIGIPIVLIEQNAIPGRANLKMSRWADAVLCHWESSKERFNKGNVAVTGVPIRSGIMENEAAGSDNSFGLDFQKKTLLIMGGSQGAQAINKVMLQSIPKLQTLVPGLQIIHLTGKHGYKEAKEVYSSTGIRSFVSEFYNDIGAAYKLSDLVISRSGANTIAEITAVGVPAILIPYPYATDNHQYWNAYELSSAGGALIIEQEELESERVTKLVSDLLMNDERLDNMKKINRSLNKPLAAARVVDKICQILKEKKARKNVLSFVSPV